MDANWFKDESQSDTHGTPEVGGISVAAYENNIRLAGMASEATINIADVFHEPSSTLIDAAY